MKHLIAIVFCAAVVTTAPPMQSAPHPTSSDDRISTCLMVPVEGGTTKTVSLRPLRRAQYLREQLSELPAMNDRVVQLLLEYPRDGTHAYWWPRKGPSPYDGSTTDILLQGKKIMRGEANRRTYCCGLTLEVCYRALLEGEKAPPALTAETADQLRKLWFCTGKYSSGPTEAMERFGIGRRIERPEDALPGDFVQIWRADGTGHSVVFVAWALDTEDRRVGMHYWSTQPGTGGLDFHAEAIGKYGKVIDLDRTSFARLAPPQQWTGTR